MPVTSYSHLRQHCNIKVDLHPHTTVAQQNLCCIFSGNACSSRATADWQLAIMIATGARKMQLMRNELKTKIFTLRVMSYTA